MNMGVFFILASKDLLVSRRKDLCEATHDVGCWKFCSKQSTLPESALMGGGGGGKVH